MHTENKNDCFKMSPCEKIVLLSLPPSLSLAQWYQEEKKRLSFSYLLPLTKYIEKKRRYTVHQFSPWKSCLDPHNFFIDRFSWENNFLMTSIYILLSSNQTARITTTKKIEYMYCLETQIQFRRRRKNKKHLHTVKKTKKRKGEGSGGGGRWRKRERREKKKHLLKFFSRALRNNRTRGREEGWGMETKYVESGGEIDGSWRRHLS